MTRDETKVLPERWQDIKTIRIPLKFKYIATAPFFLPIKPPHPPTACVSTLNSLFAKNKFIDQQ